MEDKPLHIVTGASGGIGQALTERLAKQGYRVLMACRNPEKSEPILTRIRKRSGEQRQRIHMAMKTGASIAIQPSRLSIFGPHFPSRNMPYPARTKNSAMKTTTASAVIPARKRS